MYGYYMVGDCNGYGRNGIMTVPSGWKVPFEDDYRVLMKHLEDSKFSVPGTALLQGGASGFDVVFAGYFDCTNSFNWNNDTNSFYLGTANWNDYDHTGRYFRIYNNGNVEYGTFNYNQHCIRLVKQ